MNKGLQLMQKIARLAREAQGELDRGEDQQVAIEIKLAAECVLDSHSEAKAISGLSRGSAHHD